MDIADHIRRDPEEGARRLVSELGPGLYGVALRLVGDDRAAADDLYMRALECAFAEIARGCAGAPLPIDSAAVPSHHERARPSRGFRGGRGVATIDITCRFC